MSLANEDDENLNHSSASSDGEFSDPLCVDVPTEGDSPSPSMSKEQQMVDSSSLLKAEHTMLPTKKKLSQWLTFYVKFCSSAGNQDKLLKVLQWSLWLLANTTTNNKSPRQRWMGAISDELSWARYVTRLLGLPVAVEAAANDSWTLSTSTTHSSCSSRNNVYRAIGKILSYSMVAYHPLEMLAYLQWKKPAAATAAASSSKQSKWHQPERWSYLSCRFWLAYTAAELTQCVLHWRELQKQKHLLEEAKKNDNENQQSDAVSTTSIRELDAQISNTQLQAVRDALFLLPCLHWSLTDWDTKPWLRPHTVNTLMWAESIVSLYQAVKNQL